MNIEVNVSGVDLSSAVGTHLGQYGEEEPRFLGDTVAEILAGRIATEYPTLVQQIRESLTVSVQQKLAPILEEVLFTEFQRANQFGEATGKPLTLRQFIVEEARKQLREPADRYRPEKGSLVLSLVRDEVDKALRAELLDVVRAEKTRVVALVQAKAAELIAESVKAAVNR